MDTVFGSAGLDPEGSFRGIITIHLSGEVDWYYEIIRSYIQYPFRKTTRQNYSLAYTVSATGHHMFSGVSPEKNQRIYADGVRIYIRLSFRPINEIQEKNIRRADALPEENRQASIFKNYLAWNQQRRKIYYAVKS